MTQNEVSSFLNKNFTKWTAYNKAPGLVVIKVRGPIIPRYMLEFESYVPMGVIFEFYTMGFFESLFTFNSSWRDK